MSCGVDPLEGDHGYWCDDPTPSVGAALRDARDLQVAIAWQPPKRDPVLNPELTPPEREQLATLFDALVAAREKAYPPPKLWTLREYRDIARGRKGAA